MGKILISLCAWTLLAVINAQELSTPNPSASSTVRTDSRINSRIETRTTTRPQWQGAATRRNVDSRPNQPFPDDRQSSNHSQANVQQLQKLENVQMSGIDARSGFVGNQATSNPASYDSRSQQPTNQPSGRQSYQSRSLNPPSNIDHSYRQRSNQNQPSGSHDQSSVNYIPDDVSYKPYSFNYVSDAEDGYYSHQQSADDSGRVIGSYSFTLDDGRRRVVEYIADQNGFRANIDSNEPGMSAAENPADVSYYSGYTNTNTGRSGSSVPSTETGPRGTPNRASFPGVGVRNYQPEGPRAPGFTNYRTYGTDSEFRSEDRGRQADIPEVRNYGFAQSGGSDAPLPRTNEYSPSRDVRNQAVPVVNRNEETPDINAIMRPVEPSLPEARRFDSTQGARPSESSRNIPRDQSPRQIGRPQESGISSNTLSSVGQPGLRQPSVRSYFHLGQAATSGRSEPQESSINLGPAMSSFFGSRTQGARPLSVAGESGAVNIPSGFQGNVQSAVPQGSNLANPEESRGSANNQGLMYQPSDVYGDRQQDNSARGLASSDPQNIPLVEYHSLHPDGGPQYFYSADNGQYWFHRH